MWEALSMNRDDLRELARQRLEDARVLLEEGRYSGAYYLAGYVVECGLKACISSRTKQFDFPPDRKAIETIYTHDLNKLVKSAGLDKGLTDAQKADEEFCRNWGLVKDWNEESRYKAWTKVQAQDLFEAVSNANHGVLQWISRHW
jgi:HEPN domain-containing protein